MHQLFSKASGSCLLLHVSTPCCESSCSLDARVLLGATSFIWPRVMVPTSPHPSLILSSNIFLSSDVFDGSCASDSWSCWIWDSIREKNSLDILWVDSPSDHAASGVQRGVLADPVPAQALVVAHVLPVVRQVHIPHHNVCPSLSLHQTVAYLVLRRDDDHFVLPSMFTKIWM